MKAVTEVFLMLSFLVMCENFPFSSEAACSETVSSSSGDNTAVLSPGWSFNSCSAVQLTFLMAE